MKTISEAKEYLLQIGKLSGSIARRKKELKALSSSGMSLRSPDYSSARVQSSYKGSRQEKAAEWRSDLQTAIREEIRQLAEQKHQIIGEINDLSREEYSKILYSIYVEGKDLMRVSEEQHYSYNYTCTLHGLALKELWRCHQKSVSNRK